MFFGTAAADDGRHAEADVLEAVAAVLQAGDGQELFLVVCDACTVSAMVAPTAQPAPPLREMTSDPLFLVRSKIWRW